MALLIDHQPINVPAGSHTFTVTVPNDAKRVSIRLARQTTATSSFWNVPVIVSLKADFSPRHDGEFVDWVSWEASGGIIQNHLGVELPESSVVATVPPFIETIPPNQGRRVRAIVTITGGNLVSTLTIESI